MKQTHGISRARRLGMIESAETQAVLVTDAHELVILSLSACAYPAGMTPEEAEFVANQLLASVERVRARMPEALKEPKTG